MRSNRRSGLLRDPASAPTRGEEVERLLELDGLVVEQILSGELDSPVEYLQDDDEWVVVLAGGATLLVDGERVELEPGRWLFLPAGTPHTLLRTDPGTSWLAVHRRPS